jgi:membrane protease YdiL (CAAX protease family)
MAPWLERAAGPGGLSLALIYVELVAAMTLLTTVLHFRRLRKARPELRAVRLYFVFFFALMMAGPCVLAWLSRADPVPFLVSIGWTPGRAGLGLVLAAVGLPLAVLSGFIGSRDPEMRKMYPFAKGAMADVRVFAGYEIAYVLFYYLPWEFVFRGVLFLPLVPAMGLIPALAIQTAISTLLHIGHPDSEVFAAAAAGLIFGMIAYVTGSFFATFLLHAATGVATDTFLFLRRGPDKT